MFDIKDLRRKILPASKSDVDKRAHELMIYCEHLEKLIGANDRKIQNVLETYGYCSDKTQSKIIDFLNLLEPQTAKNYDKIRVGSANDGGYVQLNDFNNITQALSFGISDNDDWDIDIAERGILVHQYDHTVDRAPTQHKLLQFYKKKITANKISEKEITLDALIEQIKNKKHGSIILKMDIEGDEWSIFNKTNTDNFIYLKQIVCEFHGLSRLSEDMFYEKALESIKKINKFFFVYHIHANNYAPLVNIANIALPDVLEVSFANRNFYSAEPNIEVFPSRLDSPCNPKRADIYMGNFRFK